MALALQTGACASESSRLASAAGVASKSCDALAADPAPSPDCCASIAALASAGCACDAATLAAAALMGVSDATIKGLLRGASAGCKAAGPAVAGPCFDAC
jgi:hypothetical protein